MHCQIFSSITAQLVVVPVAPQRDSTHLKSPLGRPDLARFVCSLVHVTLIINNKTERKICENSGGAAVGFISCSCSIFPINAQAVKIFIFDIQ